MKVEQELPEPKPLTVIELKPDTTETYLRGLTKGSVVDWGDGTKSVVTAEEAMMKKVKHTYADTSTANRIVTIDGVLDRSGVEGEPSFDMSALTAVRSLGELKGNLNGLFMGCSELTSIPAGLFDHLTKVTNFTSCFNSCNGLTAIPEGLFDHLTKVTNFSSCFSGCTGLTVIPEGLFDHCTAVIDFSYCFALCSNLTAIPEGLFNQCTAVTNFSACFESCSALTGETPYTMVDGKKVKL